MWNQRSSSRRIQERDLLREHTIHKEKLCRVSSRIDNASPKAMNHVKKNLKGRLIEKNRKEGIVYSNKILVDKLMKVNTRDTSVQKPKKRNAMLNRSYKFEEISRLNNENYRILNRIKTSKPHYSCERLRRDYKFATHIKNRISQNSGRVPKILNYTQIEFNPEASTGHKSVKSFQNTGKFEYIM